VTLSKFLRLVCNLILITEKMKVFLAVICLIAAASAFPDKTVNRPQIPTFGKGQEKVIGGQDAEKCSHPHQVSLQSPRSGAQYSHFCGGTVIAPNKIVTAAHCIQGQTISANRVVAGERDLANDDGTEQIRFWKSAVYHPQWDSQNIDFDYGVITLDSDLVFNQCVQPMALAAQGTEPAGDCVTSGWGKTTPESGIPNILQQITLPIVPRDKCSALYNEILWGITERMVCAGEQGRSVCNGDSGGPLVCRRSDNRDYLAGITSYTMTPCGETPFPSGWANVANQREWLLSN